MGHKWPLSAGILHPLRDRRRGRWRRVHRSRAGTRFSALPQLQLRNTCEFRSATWHEGCSIGGMDKILSFRDLEVWHLSMQLVDLVIADTRNMPRIEFDLTRQMRRAAISIPSNIAEGWRRKRRRAAYQNHVSIALGSHGELETQLEVCFRNGFLDRRKSARTLDVCARVGTMLDRLHDALD